MLTHGMNLHKTSEHIELRIIAQEIQGASATLSGFALLPIIVEPQVMSATYQHMRSQKTAGKETTQQESIHKEDQD
jgi:hypothetical protein